MACVYHAHPKRYLLLLLLLGLVSLISGLVLIIDWQRLLQMAINKRLTLSTNSYSYGMWKRNPIPMHTRFYFFNWTNVEEFTKNRETPAFQEVGPYTYSEAQEKADIHWFDHNSTVSYMKRRWWRFIPELSKGSENDQITTLNVPLVAASSVIKEWDSTMVTVGFNYAIRKLKENISMEGAVAQLLFDGLRTPLMAFASSLPEGVVPIPSDKFGWFYERNGSQAFDGVFNMDTGAADILKIGQLYQWNYTQQNWFYPGHCGSIHGSAGEFFPPHRNRDNISLYVTDICRSITLRYENDTSMHGILGYRYTVDPSLFANPPDNNENECFCLERGCMRSGVLDVSSCRFNTPSYVSHPHFLFSDPYYRTQIKGMKPEEDKHQTLIDLEPETGIPLRVRARFQINLLLQKVTTLKLFSDIPELMIPLIWFETSAELDSHLASQIKLLKNAPTILQVTGIFLAVIGCLLCAFSATWFYKILCANKKVDTLTHLYEITCSDKLS